MEKKKSEEEILLSLTRMFFPQDMLECFEVADFKVEGEDLMIFLDERDRLQKRKEGHTYSKNGFLPESRLTDFPVRDKRATLVVRRRRWRDDQTGEIVSNDYELAAKGTRHSKEFAAFLKGVLGQIPDFGLFS